MTYSTDDHTDEVAQERRAYARTMTIIFVALAVVWLAGAALMFTAAFKGSAMTSSPAVTAEAATPAAAP